MSLSIMRPSVLPQCTSCLRRISNLGLQEWRNGQQVRGKKKLVKVTTLTVRLLKDVPSFGRKGTYVPISIGQMRNAWFPRGTAEYVTDTQIKDMKKRNITAERDFEFGMNETIATKAALAQAQSQTTRPSKTVEVEKLTPQRSIELLAALLPPTLDFARSAREAPEPEPPAPQAPPPREKGPSSAAADLLAARSIPARPAAHASPTALYGSLSTADVANRIKHLLAEGYEANRIVISADDIRFINATVDGQVMPETDKIKDLGDYTIRMNFRGAEDVVERVVRVVPLKSSSDQAAPRKAVA